MVKLDEAGERLEMLKFSLEFGLVYKSRLVSLAKQIGVKEADRKLSRLLAIFAMSKTINQHEVRLTSEAKDRILKRFQEAITDEIAAIKNQPVRG